MTALTFTLWVGLFLGADPADAAPPESQPASAPAAPPRTGEESMRFTARFTPDTLLPLLDEKSDLLPWPMRLPGQREAGMDALRRINMGALIEELGPYLKQSFPDGFTPEHDLITTPVPEDRQVQIPAPELDPPFHRGPEQVVIGFLLHEVTENDFVTVAIRVIQRAQQLLDSGHPILDRTRPDHLRLLAEQETAALVSAGSAAEAAAVKKAEVRETVAAALGLTRKKASDDDVTPQWAKETRRYSYIIREGQFIDRLQPLVDEINKNMELAGFPGPGPLDRPGVHFDKDLKDVEITLPRPMFHRFIAEADALERRMADERIISIEAVRLTDRDILNGALAARINANIQGVHDVERYNLTGVTRQLGLNSLLAVANQQLQVQTLRAIDAGDLPGDISPVQITAPNLPPVRLDRDATVIGSEFSLGADDIFFNGQEQSYGFSYIGTDGLVHTLSIDAVDSLRKFWDRIERNLIVHKIKHTESPVSFSVPVGPDTKTFNGIAALVSQENQQLVVATGTGAISEISATAGTWLIIQDFSVQPLPGASTTLTEEEADLLRTRVLLTIFLRDPMTPIEFKEAVLDLRELDDLYAMLNDRLKVCGDQRIHAGRRAKTYGQIFDQRIAESREDAALEKREHNSVINLNFYSSQGNIIQTPGTTQLGDANDLTSFTTELRPNMVTPISSFFTKSGSGATGTSVLLGISKGESSTEEKSMTHLVIRARFPTIERERKDLEEGRHLGYFKLPIGREPQSTTDLPFLSSSEHPLERLARLRVGLMFDALQEDKIRKPLSLINPNMLQGTVSENAWETATTRLLINRKLISDSPNSEPSLGSTYREKFILEVRSLLEYDEDFYASPNFALRHMDQWNDPDRLILALENAPQKFAYQRLIRMIDELGRELVPDEYAETYLAVSATDFWGRHTLRPLGPDELQVIRRDAANHYLRYQEAYGDAFHEAISQMLDLGTYQARSNSELLKGPFRGYHDLVMFDRGSPGMIDQEVVDAALSDFQVLKLGGRSDGLFGPSLKTVEDLPASFREFVVRGRDVLQRAEWWQLYNP